MNKKYEIIGYKKNYIIENDANDYVPSQIASKLYDKEPTYEEKIQFFKDFDVDMISVQEVYFKEPRILKVSDIDLSNTVFFELSNPLYTGEECNVMEFAYDFPKERLHIIQIIKLAVRCGLTIKFHSYNKQAEKWVVDYFEMYRS